MLGKRFYERFFSTEPNIVAYTGTAVILVFAASSFIQFVPLYLASLGASVFEVGLAQGLASLAPVIAFLPGGFLADRFGRKWPIVLGTGWYGCMVAILYLVQSWQEAVPALFASSFAVSLFLPAVTSIIAESVPASEREKAFSTVFFGIAASLPFGPLLGGYIFANYGFRLLVLLAGTLIIVAALARAYVLRETMPNEEKPRAQARTEEKLRITRETIILTLLGSLFGGIGPLGGFAGSQVITFASLYGKDVLHYNEVELGLMFFAANLSAFLVALFAGVAVKTYGARKALVASAATYLLFLPWAYTSDKVIAMILFALQGTSGLLYATAFQTKLSALSPAGARSTLVALMGTAMSISGLIAPLVGAYTWEKLSPQLVFIEVSFLAPVGIILLLAAKGE